jgi:hypothetical protein
MSGAEMSAEAIAEGGGLLALQLPLTGGRHVAMDTRPRLIRTIVK